MTDTYLNIVFELYETNAPTPIVEMDSDRLPPVSFDDILRSIDLVVKALKNCRFWAPYNVLGCYGMAAHLPHALGYDRYSEILDSVYVIAKRQIPPGPGLCFEAVDVLMQPGFKPLSTLEIIHRLRFAAKKI